MLVERAGIGSVGEGRGRLIRSGRRKEKSRLVDRRLSEVAGRQFFDKSVASSELILFASCGSRGWYFGTFARGDQEHIEISKNN